MSQLLVQSGLRYFVLVVGVPALSPVHTDSRTGCSADFDRSHRRPEMSSVKTSNELSRHRCEIG